MWNLINKMNKSITLVIVLLLGVVTSSELSPRDLVDECNAQYEELRAIVEGEIAANTQRLRQKLSDVTLGANILHADGTITINSIYESMTSVINQIKDVAASSGIDITECAAGPEAIMVNLPTDAVLELQGCISSNMNDALRGVTASIDRISRQSGDVHTFRFMITSCNGALLCLAPIIEQLELAKVTIPQTIATEVQATETWLQQIAVILQECSDNTIASYNSKMVAQLNVVSECL